MIPPEEIQNKVQLRDFEFFLTHSNFLKVANTLEIYQDEFLDVETQYGRDFIVFKRQLYQLYEVRNRSVSEHIQFSGQVERENLRAIYEANQDFQNEVAQVNQERDLYNHG